MEIPPQIQPVASLCVDYPENGFPEEPVLQREGRRERIGGDELRHDSAWDHAKTPAA